MTEPPYRDPVVLIGVGLPVLVALPLRWGVAMMATMGPWMMGGRAVTQGIGPASAPPLDPCMLRCRLTHAEWAALPASLETQR